MKGICDKNVTNKTYLSTDNVFWEKNTLQRCLQAKTETARASIERKNDLFEAVSHLLNVYSLDFHINTSLKQYFFPITHTPVKLLVKQLQLHQIKKKIIDVIDKLLFWGWGYAYIFSVGFEINHTQNYNLNTST